MKRYTAPVCLVAVGAGCCIVGAFLVPFLFAVVLTDIVNKIMVIDPSSPIYLAWKNADIPIYENFYFFEVLNPDEALEGQKPQLRQRGPYVYRLKMPRNNISFFNDTVSYRQTFTYIFDEHLSVGPENETFVMINLPLATTVSMFKDFPEFIQIGMSATLTALGEKLFLPMSPKKLLWGYEEPFFKFIKSFTGNVFFDTDIFGLFLGRNGTDLGVFNVQTGMANRSELNQINSWKGMVMLPWWTGKANMINGTDGMMYHSFISKDEELYLFNADLCRSVKYVFKRRSVYRDVPLLLFGLDHFTYANKSVYPPNADFCSENCPPSGTFLVSKCRDKSPISLSNPHFLDTDAELQNSVAGLHPNEDLHLNFMNIEDIMGMPFELAIRIQLNIQTRKEPAISQTGNVRTLQFPILWFEQIVNVDDATLHEYNTGIGLSEILSTIMEYCLIALGLVFTLVGIILFYKRRKRLKKSIPNNNKSVSPEDEPLLS